MGNSIGWIYKTRRLFDYEFGQGYLKFTEN
jgi:hypothetical protein